MGHFGKKWGRFGEKWGHFGSGAVLTCCSSRSFPHSRLITGFVTRLRRRMPLVEQELPTLPEHLSSPRVLSGVHVTRSLVLCVCFVVIVVCPFVLFLLSIVLSVLLRYTDSDYLPLVSSNSSYSFEGRRYTKMSYLLLISTPSG